MLMAQGRIICQIILFCGALSMSWVWSLGAEEALEHVWSSQGLPVVHLPVNPNIFMSTSQALISSLSYWFIHHHAHLGWPMDRGCLLNSPIASAWGSHHINWELVLGTAGLAGKAQTGAQQTRYLLSTHQLLTYQPYCTSSMGLLCAWQERNQEPKPTLWSGNNSC